MIIQTDIRNYAGLIKRLNDPLIFHKHNNWANWRSHGRIHYGKFILYLLNFEEASLKFPGPENDT
jgi:hypothetical protein